MAARLVDKTAPYVVMLRLGLVQLLEKCAAVEASAKIWAFGCASHIRDIWVAGVDDPRRLTRGVHLDGADLRLDEGSNE